MDISGSTWELLILHLPGQKGQWGGVAKDNRLFINAVFWILRSGAAWRDLPPDYGDWKNVHRRFCRWRDKGVWEGLLEALVADCTQGTRLIEGISAEHLLADRGYDSNEIIDTANAQGMSGVIPPKKNRKEQRKYDNDLYKPGHLVENAFMYLRRWRGIATRYARNTASFLAAVQIRCIVLWFRIS